MSAGVDVSINKQLERRNKVISDAGATIQARVCLNSKEKSGCKKVHTQKVATLFSCPRGGCGRSARRRRLRCSRRRPHRRPNKKKKITGNRRLIIKQAHILEHHNDVRLDFICHELISHPDLISLVAN